MARISQICALVVLILLLTSCGDKVGDKYVGLAECMTNKGVKMYGAYWCPHCAEQKKLFGKQGFTKINYIECDPRGEGGNPKLCLEKNIQVYPTWEFPDGSMTKGIIEPTALSEKTGCHISELGN